MWQPEISELLVQQFNRSFFRYVVLPLFAVVGIDRCEEFGIFLITIFLELHVFAGRSFNASM
jgi:hypothetical protein